MSALLKLSRLIDRLTTWVGAGVAWFVLAAVLISAGNAIVRKLFNTSSNAWLEIQWYLFAGVFLLAAGYTLMRGEHVKIDVVLHHFSKRTQIAVELFGLVCFLMPFVVVIIMEATPTVIESYVRHEVSSNAGGLVRWPVYALVPLGFGLLGLQGISEIIKRVAFLMGLIDDPTKKIAEKSAEEELAEEILRLAQAKSEGAKP